MKMVGVVENVRRDMKGIQVGGDWYSSFNTLPPISVGDGVSFEYTEKGTFKNIKGKVTISKGNGSSETATPKARKLGEVHMDRERCIIRQNALTNAVNYTSGTGLSVAEVLEIASAFEKYTSGDNDVTTAEQAMEELND